MEGIWPGHRGYTPTLYDECHGIFNDHRESRPRFNVSSERRKDQTTKVQGPIDPLRIIRAQATKAQGPIVFLRIIRAQTTKAQGPIDPLRIIHIYIFFFKLPGGFGGLNVLTNS